VRAEASYYCRCGGMMSLRVRGVDAIRVSMELAEAFRSGHDGPDCAPATAQEAAAARNRLERDV
jgi:hypothetical protein